MISTVQSGLWSSGDTWVGGTPPSKQDAVTIAHDVILDVSVVIASIYISVGASVTYTSSLSLTIDSGGNFINNGILTMIPDSTSIIHTVLFHGVDETKYVGGGMNVISTDVGLWNKGTLNLHGTSKTAWTTLVLGVTKGTRTIIVEDSTGWNIGDEITLAPTTPITSPTFYTGWDTSTIANVSGNTILLSTSLLYDHSVVVNPFGSPWTAEVLNLTRNVRIEGRQSGRAHIHNVLLAPMNISYVQIRYMGPRQSDGQGYTKDVLGRYSLHFHMCGNATQQSSIESVVVRDGGSHSFVPHASHGITFHNCISFNTFEDAYWWDGPPSIDSSNPINNSNDTIIDECIAAMTKCDPSFRGYRLAGFTLGSGLRNMICDSIAVGNQGSQGAAGFVWPESSNFTDDVWLIMGNNISHNNRTDGIFVWENDPHNHLVTNFSIYNNGAYGIEHGAYTNGYKYSDITLVGNKNAILLYSNPISTGTPDSYGYILDFQRVKSDSPLYITSHTLPGRGPTLFKDCKFSKVIINEIPKGTLPSPSGLLDFVNCTIFPSDIYILSQEVGSRIRIQDNTAFQINDKGIYKTIPQFLNI